MCGADAFLGHLTEGLGLCVFLTDQSGHWPRTFGTQLVGTWSFEIVERLFTTGKVLQSAEMSSGFKLQRLQGLSTPNRGLKISIALFLPSS